MALDLRWHEPMATTHEDKSTVEAERLWCLASDDAPGATGVSTATTSDDVHRPSMAIAHHGWRSASNEEHLRRSTFDDPPRVESMATASDDAGGTE
jgi:hypothetical protein